MISAVVFDCFGVLVNDGWLPFKNKYFGRDARLFSEATDLNKQFDAGMIAFEDFVQGVADLAEIQPGAAYKEIQQNQPNKALLEYIAKLKQDYKIGILSNVGENWLPDLFTATELALFDATVLSCDIGTVKPDPRMYTTVADKLEASPDECLFIDDQPRYCAGAEAVGMKSIQYVDTDNCIAAIQKLLGSSARN